jgi:hypothetical protein
MTALAPLPFRRLAFSSHLGDWEFLYAPPPADLAGIVETFWISRGRQRSLKLFLINGGYHTLQYTLIGLILGVWH